MLLTDGKFLPQIRLKPGGEPTPSTHRCNLLIMVRKTGRQIYYYYQTLGRKYVIVERL